MIIKRLRSGIDIRDQEFDSMYSDGIKMVSEIHFTPVIVAKTAAGFLARPPGARVLDVGSGAGKFCMIGAACFKGHFTGIEQRETLVLLAQQLTLRYQLLNANFRHANVMDVDFQSFNAIYYYNPFFENIFQDDPIDTSITLAKNLYATYTEYVKYQLTNMPAGTRLATYFSTLEVVPETYQLVEGCFDNKLKLWEKI